MVRLVERVEPARMREVVIPRVWARRIGRGRGMEVSAGMVCWVVVYILRVYVCVGVRLLKVGAVLKLKLPHITPRFEVNRGITCQRLCLLSRIRF